MILGVGVRDERGRQSRGRVQHLRVDTIAVHLSSAGFVAARRMSSNRTQPFMSSGARPAQAFIPKLMGSRDAFDDPRVTLVEVLDPGSTVA